MTWTGHAFDVGSGEHMRATARTKLAGATLRPAMPSMGFQVLAARNPDYLKGLRHA